MPEAFAGGSAGGEVDGGVEGAEPAAWNNTVHDVAGGMGGVAGAVVGAEGCGDRDAGGEPGRVEIEGLIGFFVNTLVLRLDLSVHRR